MLIKPDLEPTFTEQAFRLVGWLTVAIGVAVIVAAAVVSQQTDPVDSGLSLFVLAYGGYVGVIIILCAPTPFAFAEIFGRLRRQEERELTRAWEADRAASERAALASRERRQQAALQHDERDG